MSTYPIVNYGTAVDVKTTNSTVQTRFILPTLQITGQNANPPILPRGSLAIDLNEDRVYFSTGTGWIQLMQEQE